VTDPIPFLPNRFRTAAEHYLAGRPPYAPALIARVVQVCGLSATDRVLDLGCGPGQLGRAFAPSVAAVVGIDPEPEMLRIAREMSAGLTNVDWLEGSSYDLSPTLGNFKLVSIGRAFHWMDRPDTLRRLDGLVVADGAVALFSDSAPDVPDNAWRAAYREVLDRYAGEDSARARWRSPGWVRHEAILLDSAFAHVEQIAVIERKAVTAATLITRALSMSSTAPGRLGERVDAMIADLRAVLPAEGTLLEVVASTAMIAWRAG
jgi:SAM-dependent methyltransferase